MENIELKLKMMSSHVVDIKEVKQKDSHGNFEVIFNSILGKVSLARIIFCCDKEKINFFVEDSYTAIFWKY